MTPYYDEDGITIYHGDCRDLLDHLEFQSIITDPPYGTGHYPTDGDAFTPSMLADFVASVPTAVFGWPEKLVGLCVAAGVVPDEWVTWWPTNGAQRGTNLRGLWRESEVVAAFGPHRFCDLRRARNAGGMRLTRSAHAWETSGSVKKSRPRAEPSEDARLGDVWTDAAPGLCNHSHLRQHPNEKPMGVLHRLVEAMAVGTVLDPFMGSGTTLRAAIDDGYNAIGIEISEEFCEVAAKRLAQGVLGFAS